MKMKREALDAFEKHPDERVRKGIESIISEYLLRDGKQWGDGSVGTIRMSPKEFRDLLAFMASDTEVPSESSDPNFVPGP